MNHIKHILLLNLLGLLCLAGNGQSFKFGFQTGVGSYEMKDLKDFNATVFKSLPFQAKQIADYPAYFYYKPSFSISFNKINVGVMGTYHSTGSRISSKDYSGEYLFDTRVSSLGPGLMLDFSLFSIKDKFKGWISLEGGALFSKLNMKEDFTLGEEEINNSTYDFKAVNYYTQPGIKLEYKLLPPVSVALNAGYCVQLYNSKFESEKDGMLNFGPDWSGLRVGLSIFVSTPLNNRNKEPEQLPEGESK